MSFAAESTDEALFAAYLRGDVRAFQTLYGRYRRPVYAFLLRFVHDAALAEDLYQETFMKALKQARDFEARSRFSTWIFRIARNSAIDALRRRAVRQAESLDAPARPGGSVSLGATLDGGKGDPAGAANQTLIRETVAATLARLPEEQREVFSLREFAGLKFHEIATITGVNENTVKSRMRYALETLREALDAAGVEMS